MCAAHVNNFSSNLVERVDFSDSRVVYKFFLINNIELKCSFVRCRKYHKSWSNGAAELHISVDLFCGTTAAELHICVRLTSITFPVIGRACCFSDSRVALLWADL